VEVLGEEAIALTGDRPARADDGAGSRVQQRQRPVAFQTRLERRTGAVAPDRSVVGDANAETFNRELKRIIPLYRIAPAVREIGTVEFDGRFENGRRTTTLRDVLRRGVLDLRGNHIWRATLQSVPLPEGQAPPK
jgi:hypothetical protein